MTVFYTTPAGVEATEEELAKAALTFEVTFGSLEHYNEIPSPVKRFAAAMAVGSSLNMSVDEVNEQGNESKAFRDLVFGLVESYETAHPDKVNQKEKVSDALEELASRLRWDVPPESFTPAEEKLPAQPDIDAEFALIIGEFESSDAKPEADEK